MFTTITAPDGHVFRIVKLTRKRILLADSFGMYWHKLKPLIAARWDWSEVPQIGGRQKLSQVRD